MTKPLQRKVEQIKTIRGMESRQLVLCKQYGGAWIASIMPFSHEVHFLMFDSPSKIPDIYIHSNNPFYDPQIAYRGKLIDFSRATKIREQNRGIGGDR